MGTRPAPLRYEQIFNTIDLGGCFGMICDRCKHEWYAAGPDQLDCPKCGHKEKDVVDESEVYGYEYNI